jgi:hypothetical protein
MRTVIAEQHIRKKLKEAIGGGIPLYKRLVYSDGQERYIVSYLIKKGKEYREYEQAYNKELMKARKAYHDFEEEWL